MKTVMIGDMVVVVVILVSEHITTITQKCIMHDMMMICCSYWLRFKVCILYIYLHGLVWMWLWWWCEYGEVFSTMTKNFTVFMTRHPIYTLSLFFLSHHPNQHPLILIRFATYLSLQFYYRDGRRWRVKFLFWKYSS